MATWKKLLTDDHTSSHPAPTSRDTRNQVAGTYNTIIGTDTDIDCGTAEHIDTIVVTDGVITSMSKQALTLAELGFTGATNANYLAIGETSSTAHAGDRGATAYTHSQVTGGVHATGTVTSVGTNTGLSGTVTGSGSLSLDLDSIADMTQTWVNGTDEFIVLDDGTQKKKLSSEIFGSNAFNSTTIPTNNNQLTNGAGFTTNAGDITSVTAGTGMTGTATSGACSLNVVAGTGITANANDIATNLDGLPDMTQTWANGTDEFIVLDDGAQKKKLSSEIFGSNAFNSTTIYSLGSSSGSAHRGDHGNTAYNHSQVSGGVHNSGTVTSVGTNTGLSGTVTSSGSLSLDLDSLADMTQSWVNATDEFIVLDDGTQKKKVSSEIFGSNAFNSTAFTTNVGTVTAVSGSAPVVSSGGTTPAISMAKATGSTNGFLDQTDWTTFNNKGSSNLVIGTGSGNAHRGDHGATAYTHSQVTGGVHAVGTVTSVSAGTAIDISGTATTTPTVNVDLSELGSHTIGDGSGTITISGNLTVSGTTTTVNTEEIKLADNNILINAGNAGAGADGGITIDRGSETDMKLYWNEAKDTWYGQNGTTGSGGNKLLMTQVASGAPDSNDNGGGVGQFYTNNSNQDIYIRTA